MKIKRYLEKDMRQVLRRVREDQGPDAVILSNRRVDGGIEVVAALDYDAALVQHALGPQAGIAPQSPSARKAAKVESSNEDAGDNSTDFDDTEANVQVVSTDLKSTDTEDTESERKPATNTWSQETTLVSMKSELASLRGMVETQLSGLVWKDGARRSPMRAQILRNLARLGIAPDVANMTVNRLEPIGDIEQMWHPPLAALAQLIPLSDDTLLERGGTAALIGPTGVGKTTTIAKIAARFAIKHGTDDIALVSADAYRIGAQDHLTTIANILGVNIQTAEEPDELTGILDRLHGKKLILIDTEGMGQRDIKLNGRLAAFGRNEDRVNFYLVLSAASQEGGLDETVRKFSQVPLAGSIVTKIDEAGQLGCAISALIRHDLPLAYVSNGQRIPDDLHLAVTKRLWLVNQAIECMQSSEPRINERTMAENYTKSSVANA